ncbi:hypothetical protein DY000_02056789 [Brassica cretica]|uniref:Uncharacterized protein n=1 Tax=Brassica cretica TaxID=69181 RepID=A0ABQ7ABB6_BRACR|nr:hypothetical protein DY000_02056789 [Brassica cretica]
MGVYGPGIGGLVTAISSSLSRTTAPLVLMIGFLGSCRFLLVASRFEPPFSPGARGNRGLSPLIPFPWAIDATLTPVCL